jgi:WD40 repeat protein
VSASHDHTVRVWQLETGECLQNLNIGTLLYHMSFSRDDSYLLTEIGPIILDASTSELSTKSPPTKFSTSSIATNTSTPIMATEAPRRYGYGLSSNGSWVTWHGQNVLWLPLEYRPALSRSAVAGSCIVVGCDSGKTLIINFSSDVSPLSEGWG